MKPIAVLLAFLFFNPPVIAQGGRVRDGSSDKQSSIVE